MHTETLTKHPALSTVIHHWYKNAKRMRCSDIISGERRLTRHKWDPLSLILSLRRPSSDHLTYFLQPFHSDVVCFMTFTADYYYYTNCTSFASFLWAIYFGTISVTRVYHRRTDHTVRVIGRHMACFQMCLLTYLFIYSSIWHKRTTQKESKNFKS